MPRIDDIRGLEWQGSTAGPLPVIAPLTVGVGAPIDILMAPRPMNARINSNYRPVGNLLSVGATGPIVYSVSSQSTAGALAIDNDNYTVAQSQVVPVGPYTVVIRGTNVGTGGYYEKQFAFTCVAYDGLWLDNGFEINNGNPSYAGSSLHGNKYGYASDLIMTDASGYFGFENSYTSFEPNAKGVYPPPGDYPLTFKSPVGGLGYNDTFIITVIQGAPSTAIQTVMRTVYSVAKVGQIVGMAYAFNQNNTYTWTTINSENGGFFILANADGTANIVVAQDYPAQGSHTIRVQVANGSNSYQQDITFSVLLGTLLPASAMTFTPSGVSLNNVDKLQFIGTFTVASITGASKAFTVTTPYDNPGDYNNSMNIAAIDPTGKATAVNMLSGRIHMLTVSCTDGPNLCVFTQSITSLWPANVPAIHVGRGMAAAHPGQGYEHLHEVQGNYNGIPSPGFAGAEIRVYYDSDPNYYANDNGGNPLDWNLRYEWNGPVKLTGIADPTTGRAPRCGGLVGSLNQGSGSNNKGFFNIGSGDVIIDGFEVSYVNGPDSGHQMSCIRINGDEYGDKVVRNCILHDTGNGIEVGGGPNDLLAENNLIYNVGQGYVGSGATHGMYIGSIANITVQNNLVYRGTNGHLVKSRSLGGMILNNRLYDTETGCSSCPIDISNGGVYTVRGNSIQKGANPQNPFAINYGPEGTVIHHPRRNVLTVDANTFGVFNTDTIGLCTAVRHNGLMSTLDNKSSKVVLTNNSMYLSPYATQYYVSNGDPGFVDIPSNTATVILAIPPPLNMTHPCPATPWETRPGLFIQKYDTSQNYVQWDGLQVLLDVDEFRSTASFRGVLGTASPNGFAPDMSVTPVSTAGNPYASGALFSISQQGNLKYGGPTQPLAPVGTYTVSTAGAITAVGPFTQNTVNYFQLQVTTTTGTSPLTYRFYHVIDGA